jgi:hypothetical protein
MFGPYQLMIVSVVFIVYTVVVYRLGVIKGENKVYKQQSKKSVS